MREKITQIAYSIILLFALVVFIYGFSKFIDDDYHSEFKKDSELLKVVVMFGYCAIWYALFKFITGYYKTKREQEIFKYGTKDSRNRTLEEFVLMPYLIIISLLITFYFRR